LVVVGKTFGADALRAAAAAGAVDFGENRVQEALPKVEALAALKLIWHFIGPLQSNKTAEVAANFAWVHSVDRLKIAERLSAQRPARLPPLNVCIQLNVSGEASKSGVDLPEAEALARAVTELPHLKLRGLMTIPQPTTDPGKQRAAFAQVRECYERLRAKGLELDTLSMGMSGDLEAAIMEGATIVRIGTDIFGARN
jgi:pyridoxal phosphate enzyme (YggS family)